MELEPSLRAPRKRGVDKREGCIPGLEASHAHLAPKRHPHREIRLGRWRVAVAIKTPGTDDVVPMPPT